MHQIIGNLQNFLIMKFLYGNIYFVKTKLFLYVVFCKE